MTAAGAAFAVPLAGLAPKACIWIWQDGGASHLDTFDPKPRAPREIRGEFAEIPTSVPGIRISEHLPRTARLMRHLTIIRSMCSGETNHERAVRHIEAAAPWDARSVWREARWDAAYAGTPLGRECLDARQRVEAGARFVMVGRGRPVYDTHADNFRVLRARVLPEFDLAFSTLIEDLRRRGLLEGTLVVATGEFGRTPRINARGGRDHHAGAWSAVLAGCGLPGGRVIGATDATGTEVVEHPVTAVDLVRLVRVTAGLENPQEERRAI